MGMRGTKAKVGIEATRHKSEQNHENIKRQEGSQKVRKTESFSAGVPGRVGRVGQIDFVYFAILEIPSDVIERENATEGGSEERDRGKRENLESVVGQ